jgi:hypothetical protein
MHRKMQNNMKMIYFRSVKTKKSIFCKNVSCPHVPVTTTHCRFYKEQHWGPAPPKDGPA